MTVDTVDLPMVAPVYRLPYHAGLVKTRIAARLAGRPLVAVLSGAGDDNFGDEWMMEALEIGLPSCELVAVTHPATERRLALLGLSGPRFFAGMVVSGGTLINPYFMQFLRPLAGLASWTVGTGVGSPGFGTPETVAGIEEWVDVLNRFQQVTVRGPLSAARLASAGFNDALAIGDLALVHTPAKPVITEHSRDLFVNFSGTDKEPAYGQGLSEVEVISAIARALISLSREGWMPVPLIMHRDDISRLDDLGRKIGGWKRNPIRPRTAAEAADAMKSAGAVIGMRLHAAVLGWIHGVRTIGLAYRDKTLDCAGHLGARDQIVDLRVVNVGTLEDAIRDVTHRSSESALSVHGRALCASTELKALMRQIDTCLSQRSG